MHVGSSLLSFASPFLAFFTLVLLIIPQSPVSLILIPRLPMTLIRISSVFPSVPQSCVLNQPVLRLIHPCPSDHPTLAGRPCFFIVRT
jgi:hypothetical protein